ncbi:MAG: hypothetical protein ABSG03_42530 [Bryobacteraceae bacterium]|jgi:hypothetical protein
MVNQYGTVTNTAYLTTGVPYLMSDGDGMTVGVATAGSTAYSLPSALRPNSNGNPATSLN